MAALEGPFALFRVDLDHDPRAARQGDGEGLCGSHAAEPGREDEPAGERTAEVLPPHGSQELVDALQDALEADVLPVPRP